VGVAVSEVSGSSGGEFWLVGSSVELFEVNSGACVEVEGVLVVVTSGDGEKSGCAVASVD